MTGVDFHYRISDEDEAKVAGSLIAFQIILAEMMAERADIAAVFGRIYQRVDRLLASEQHHPLSRAVSRECVSTIENIGGLIALFRDANPGS